MLESAKLEKIFKKKPDAFDGLLLFLWYSARTFFTHLGSSSAVYLEYKDSDYKYYYFKDTRNNRYVKILKEENGEKLDIYTNWLNNK